jgi:ABC-type branched-subunit amino acid transport system substrate-binding protein
VKRPSVIALIVLITAGVVVTGAATAGAQSKEAPKATEIGVTATEIRIAVVADVDNPFAPGLFQGSVDAVNGAAKYINSQGGIGGRKLKVDFIDSHLNGNQSRNAIITACSQDFALVGTAALFLPTVEDEVNCKDITGKATGLPDLGGIVTGVAEQCSPVSYPANAPQLLCATKDQHPQTYQGNQGDSKYYMKKFGKNLHGAFVLPNDTQDANRGDAVQEAIAVQAGIKADQSPTASGRDPQSVYTPVVNKMKTDNSNYGFNGLAYSNVIEFRQEAQLQGLTDPKIIWACTTACYDKKYLTGGSAVDNTYIPMAFLPFDETSSNKSLAAFVKYTGKDKATGLGVYSWVAGLELQQALNNVVQKSGVNAITRANLLDSLSKLTSFNAGGMIGTTNVAQKTTTSCFVLEQVKNGKFTRVYPTKKGTFDCTPSNHVNVKADLIK